MGSDASDTVPGLVANVIFGIRVHVVKLAVVTR
jgi:hypothetical protein